MKSALFLFFKVVVIFLFSAFVWFGKSNVSFAQVPGEEPSDEEFFDDEEYLDEPNMDDDQQNIPNNRPGNPRGMPGGGPRTNFNVPNPGGYSGGRSGGGNAMGSSGEIEFRLVNPPQFWTPKKRKIRPIPNLQKE